MNLLILPWPYIMRVYVQTHKTLSLTNFILHGKGLESIFVYSSNLLERRRYIHKIISFCHCYALLSFSWYNVSKDHQPLFSVFREPWRRLGVYMPKWSERMQGEYISSMSSKVAYNSSGFQTTGSSCALYHVVVVWCLSIVWFNNKIQNYRSIRNARLCDNKGATFLTT